MDLTATQIDLRDVKRGFAGLTRQADSRARSFFAEAQKHARADLRERQRDRRGPGGEAWPGRAPATMARRGRSRSRGLLGRLPRAWKSRVAHDGVTLVNPVPFAELHHSGGTVGRGARVAARPFIGFTNAFVNDVRDAWADFVLKGWRRG